MPFAQSVQLADPEISSGRVSWSAGGIPTSFYFYEGLSHYASEADNATTCNWRPVGRQMWQGSLDCVRGFLPGE